MGESEAVTLYRSVFSAERREGKAQLELLNRTRELLNRALILGILTELGGRWSGKN